MRRPLALPTDLQILQEIYDRYYESFVEFSSDKAGRGSKIFVPIDLPNLASHFRVDVDIVFGRLYYYLDHKFGRIQPDGSRISLFTPKASDDLNCVNFPLLGAALAQLREEREKHLWTLTLSITSIVISVVALVVSTLK